MKNIIFIIIASVLITACGKDKFNTKPTLTYKGVNEKTIYKNSDLKIELNATDAEGDLTDSLIVLKRVRNCSGGNRNDKYALPIFPVKTKLNINILVAYKYGQTASSYPGLNGPLCGTKNDSCVFRFVLKDKAGNLSDTVTTPEIVIINQ
jgi:hypothetical protein